MSPCWFTGLNKSNRSHGRVSMIPRTRLYALAAYALLACLTVAFFAPIRTEAGVALLVIGMCVLISVLEIFPPWAMTVAFWLLAPLALNSFGTEYAVWRVVAGSLNPVLIVFTAGFAFAGAAQKHGIDEILTNAALRSAGGDHYKLLALIALCTVWLSAWISNIAAAALMFGTLRPMLRQKRISHSQHRSLLLVIAIAANLGGLATPIATGSNAVAVAELAADAPVNFAQWMLFGLPLTAIMVGTVTVAAVIGVRPVRWHPVQRRTPTRPRSFEPRTATIFVLTVLLWVLEPLHHVPAVWCAAGAIVALLATRAIGWHELRRLDWGALVLIMGGIGIGSIMNQSGAARVVVAALPLSGDQPELSLFVLCLLSAALASVMSNTGTAALLIPIALAVLPAPSTAILVALATSFGFPFVVSTPANAMAIRTGVRSADLLRAGLFSIALGCSLIALTGRLVLRLVGIP